MTPEQQQFVDKCKQDGFDNSQVIQIAWGFEDGLSFGQVFIYARKEFGFSQMDEIRKGFRQGLTSEQVSLYANAGFGWIKMIRIRNMLKTQPFEEVKTKVALMILEI